MNEKHLLGMAQLILLTSLCIFMEPATAYTTIFCGSTVNHTPSVSWSSEFPTGYVKSKLKTKSSLARAQCGREYRGTLKIKGSTAFKNGDSGPMAVVAKKVENGCTITSEDTAQAIGSVDSACGAWVEFAPVINGIQTTSVVKKGCALNTTNYYYINPKEVDVKTISYDGCKYPPENNATSSIPIPNAPFKQELCDGKYTVSWEAIPGATSYILVKSIVGSSIYQIHYSGSGTFIGPLNPISVPPGGSSKLHVWVKACNGTVCGFHSEPTTLNYYSGCP